MSEGASIVERVNHKNIRLLCDLFHMTADGEPPQAIVDAGKHIRHCHIAEAAERTAPGTDGDDFRPYLRALKKSATKAAYRSNACGKISERNCRRLSRSSANK